MRPSTLDNTLDCGKAPRIARAVRIVIFAALAVAIYAWFPVPSARTPDAKLAINAWANRMSAEIGKFVCIGIGFGDEDSIQVHGAVLSITGKNGSSADIPSRSVTYQNDNIVAAALSTALFLCAYLFIVEHRRHNAWRKVLALAQGTGVFAVCFVLRDAFFGVLAAQGHLKMIESLDNPIRLTMLMVLVCFTFLAIAMREKEPAP